MTFCRYNMNHREDRCTGCEFDECINWGHYNEEVDEK